MLDEEIDRALDRMRQARREMKQDIVALEEERQRRRERRQRRRA
jgi:endonuclease/exonuclease/phosphatase family metal-dependent hydrolase